MSRDEHAIENCIFSYYYHKDDIMNVDKIWEKEEARRNNVDDIHEIFTQHEIDLIETTACYVRFTLCNSWNDFCKLLGRESY